MIKIGELSSLTGIPIQTIRFYERKGLIRPIEVDEWTNYRYYDEQSVVRLREITYLKELGFTLKQIKNLSENLIRQKIDDSKINIEKLTNNINKLSGIRKKEGGFLLRNFVNDERVIGKWKKVGIVKQKEDYKINKFDNIEIFNYNEFPAFQYSKLYFLKYNELYFLPEGNAYNGLSWTKEIFYECGEPHKYEIIDGKLFIYITNESTNEIDNYVVYEKVDNKKYTRRDIRRKDNIDIPFVNDEEVIGFWKAVDFVKNPDDFYIGKTPSEFLYFNEFIFKPNGELLDSKFVDSKEGYKEEKFCRHKKWTKNFVLDRVYLTASKYKIKTIDNNKYMFMEGKFGGDYYYGTGALACYVVLKKEN